MPCLGWKCLIIDIHLLLLYRHVLVALLFSPVAFFVLLDQRQSVHLILLACEATPAPASELSCV